ncbi:MAG: hypothetical protein GY720_12630 [bacterium]|nr:hypothetical protein [bacterium]
MPDGAYGLRLGGDAPRSSLLTAVAADAPEIVITRVVGPIAVPNHVDKDKATVPLLDGGGLELDRAELTATITTQVALTDDELAHPYLAPVAAVHSHWLGRAAFHAGGIVVAGRAWGVIGEREAGKSTLLAAVSALGGIVLADDLLVVADGEAFSGPRTLDLRKGAADWFGGTRALGVAGARERWRVDLGPAPASVPLGGWIVPSWSEELTVTPRPGAAAAHYIAPARSVTGLAISPNAFLAAAARPAVEFSRPREFAKLEAGVQTLLDELALANQQG